MLLCFMAEKQSTRMMGCALAVTEHILHLRNTLQPRGNVPSVYVVLHGDGIENGLVTCASLAHGMDGWNTNRDLGVVPTHKTIELYYLAGWYIRASSDFEVATKHPVEWLSNWYMLQGHRIHSQIH